MTLSPIEYIGSKPRRPKKKNNVPKVILFLLTLGAASYFGLKYGAPDLLAAQGVTTKKHSVDDLLEGSLSEDTKLNNFISAALKRTTLQVSYDPAYYEMTYPMGDIPADKGVCTDVIIRTYREINVDLQQLVHEDMMQNYQSYPSNWELNEPDSNIDHRRVPNLKNFFNRNGKSLTISKDANDYKVGDLVTWKLSHGAPHIGIVVPSNVEGDLKPWIVHNVGIGPQWEDALFDYEITGHYRFRVD